MDTKGLVMGKEYFYNKVKCMYKSMSNSQNKKNSKIFLKTAKKTISF